MVNRREFLKYTGTGVVSLAAVRSNANVSQTPSAHVGEELGPVMTGVEVRRPAGLTGRKAALFIDDVIWIFRDIARQRPGSIFDQPLLKGLKDAHERYGLKVQLNLFYRTDFLYGTDEFTLAEMPDAYRSEWQAAKDWLRLSFHSLQESPDYPFVNAEYRDVAFVFDRIFGEVKRFAGEGVFTYAIVPHWLPVSKEGCRAFADRGVKVISSTDGPRRAYGGDPFCLPYGHAKRVMQNRKPETALYTRVSNDIAITSSICAYNHLMADQARLPKGTFAVVYDRETRMGYKWFRHGPMLNLSTMEQVKAETEAVLGSELIVFGDHEQYFYPFFYRYQPDYLDKIMLASRLVREHGYMFTFIEETVG